MNDRKDIDRLFEEKLKGFEASPNPEVWNAIEAKLKKKKRRVLPMWWLYGGAAAVLIIGFLIYPSVTKTTTLPVNEKEVVVEQSDKEVPTKNNEENKLEQTNIEEVPVEVIAIKKEPKKNAIDTTKSIDEKRKKNSLYDEINTTNELIASKRIIPDKTREGVLSGKKTAMKKILPNINKKDSTLIVKDSILKKMEVKKDFIAEMSEKDSTTIAKKEKDKWALSPVFAIIKSNSFTNTSSLDQSLATTETTGNNNFSYGVKVAYQLADKWTIQSGVLVQKMGYTNDNLSILSNVKGSSLQGVDYEQEPSFMLVETRNGTSDVASLSAANVETQEATLTQNYNYIEVPIEVKYTFLETNRFNSKIVTGFSSLFLSKNNIMLSSSILTENLGKANNLNAINFSGNIGIDIEYSINPKLKFTVNPMFKMPLNTFSKNDNGFRPYTIGVYSGISYQF
ncbi:Outer membrane protein beta-barrel domain-containing protein [Tenacibaculum sp. 190524A02b]|uniref:outer membrane beta-barrel protein n=1 Tax=Tenacibaculum vairaonense TaxID=3137860 RepID=UPI0032B0F167